MAGHSRELVSGLGDKYRLEPAGDAKLHIPLVDRPGPRCRRTGGQQWRRRFTRILPHRHRSGAVVAGRLGWIVFHRQDGVVQQR